MTDTLNGKVAVVTGGMSGIGLAAVEAFVAEGAQVVVGDIQDEAGDALTARLGDAVRYVRADVTEDEQVRALVAAAVEHFGKLDVMFNNAGGGGDPAPLTELEPEAFDRTLALLTRSVVSGHRHAARQFEVQGSGGSVISTASAAAFQGGWGAASYTIAKHAVVGVVRQAAAEMAHRHIRSNAICPGIIMTPIMAYLVPPHEREEFLPFLSRRIEERTSLRPGSPADVAGAAVFFASDLSTFVTGAALPVDGGATAATQADFAALLAEAAQDFAAR